MLPLQASQLVCRELGWAKPGLGHQQIRYSLQGTPMVLIKFGTTRSSILLPSSLKLSQTPDFSPKKMGPVTSGTLLTAHLPRQLLELPGQAVAAGCAVARLPGRALHAGCARALCPRAAELPAGAADAGGRRHAGVAAAEGARGEAVRAEGQLGPGFQFGT